MAKSKPKKEPDNVVAMTEDQFKKAIGANKIETIDQATINQRIMGLVSGKTKPPNQMIEYFTQKLKDGESEAHVVKTNINEVQQRLTQLQKRMIELQGEQRKYVNDIMEWWDRK